MDQTKKRLLRVFLCYAKADRTAVHLLYNRLLVSEVDAWLDEEKLVAGQKWQQEIPNAVKSSDVVILCLSKNSINKEGYIQKEIEFALNIASEKTEGAIYIIPARLEDCDIPDRVSVYQWVDLFEKEGEEKGEKRGEKRSKEEGYERLLRSLSLRAEQIDVVLPSKNTGLFSFPSSMGDPVPNSPIEFREEIVKRLFDYVENGESFYIVSASNVGQARLMDFVLGDDPDSSRGSVVPDPGRVKKHYLGDQAASKTWLVRVDMNRLRAENDWGFGFFELLLNALLLACHKSELTETTERLREDIAALDSNVIESRDALKALRLFEMVVNMLCHSYGIRLCFLFDEFDESYQDMPRELFAHLRAVQDANKYRVSYGLLLRNLPEILRDPIENEAFYELISRNMLGLGPYSKNDTIQIIQQLEKRRAYTLSPKIREWLYEKSGGHPGLVQALFSVLKENPNATKQMSKLDWHVKQDVVQDELRRIRAGLTEDERSGLLEFVKGNRITMSPTTGKLLTAKGLLRVKKGRMDIFSPLFKLYLRKYVKLQ